MSPKAPRESINVVIIERSPGIFLTVRNGLNILKALNAVKPLEALESEYVTIKLNQF